MRPRFLRRKDATASSYIRTTFVVLVLALFVLGQSTWAFSQDEGVTLTTKAGFDGRFVAGRPVPVSVVVESSRAIAAQLALIIQGSGHVHTVDIEVPAGGKKQFDLVARPLVPDRLGGNPTITVAVLASGEQLAQERLLLTEADAPLLAVLGDAVPPGLSGARTKPDDTSVRALVLGEEWISLGHAALGSLSFIVGDSEQLRLLAPEDQETLMDWVVGGGRLLLTSQRPDDLPWLSVAGDLEWALSEGRWQETSGRGIGRLPDAVEVDVGMGAITIAARDHQEVSGDTAFWETLLRPAPSRSLEVEALGFGPASSDQVLANALSRLNEESLRLPWFALFLLVYVVVVGPINYLVLKQRGKRDWAWVTIPALALLFSAVAFGLSVSARGGVSFQHASVIYAVSEGEFGSVLATASSPGGANERLGFPSKDIAVVGFDRGRVSSKATGRGSEALLQGSPFSLEAARGSLDSIEGTLSAELEWDGRGFFGTVTNNTRYHLREARVMIGPVEATAGPLEPGATAEVALVPEVTGVRTGQAFQSFAFQQEQEPELQVRELLMQDLTSLTGLGTSVIAPVVIGFTEDHDPGLSLGGRPLRAYGRSLIASPATLTFPEGTSGRLPPIVGTVAKTGVSNLLSGGASQSFGFGPFGPFGRMAPWGVTLGGFEETVLVQKLPPTLEVDRITGVSLRLKVEDPVGQPQLGARGGQSVTPPPTTVRFLVEIYNWAILDWIKVEVPITGPVDFTGDLPEAVVSQEGEVVLRITPEGIGDTIPSLVGVEVGVQ